MLSKANRLSIREFDLVIKTGREVYSPFFTVKFSPSKEFKFAPTAPKKTFKTAVSRNRVRRRIYAAVRKVAPLEREKQNHIVLIVKKDIADISADELARMIESLFVRARLIA